MRLRKILLALVLGFGCVFAQQPKQNSVSTKHLMVTLMAYDSLRSTQWFSVSDLENIATVVSTLTKDSANFYYCWQRGYRDENDTIIWKRPSFVIDTFNTLTAGNFQSIGAIISAPDSDLVKALDSLQNGSNTVSQVEQFSPKWSPVARLWFKGLTGNKHTLYNIFVTVNQRGYVPVRNTAQ
jgi:hypothetical protein